ncbi:DUF2065 domain-containing protein [Thiomicrorhabdus arctica]|jgi:hypothetical protein|uniref:DUF2065 domain-containing protein n=1 Tax=Thiomicrorhabdus arctica TaxID=131540 RepID=UPI00036B5575|nr:DUF2065 family protein [Thiomicrorhabdus arctica]
MFETALISALALVFIIEGLLPFMFPKLWQKMMSEAILLTEKQLRLMGLVSISLGLAVLMLFTT